MLKAEKICVARDGITLVDQISFTLIEGELVVILGPNGAGKSTLLKAVLGFEKDAQGTVEIDEQAFRSLSTMERARRIAYLPQTRPLAWPSRVRDVVALGRYAYGMTLGKPSIADQQAVDQSLADCDLVHLADRAADTLSGGELSRMHCARIFAAQTTYILADEPVTALDPKHQHQVLRLLKERTKQGIGAMVVLHDFSLAAQYADRLIWMKEGQLVAQGSIADTMTSAQIQSVFDVKTQVSETDNRISVHIIG